MIKAGVLCKEHCCKVTRRKLSSSCRLCLNLCLSEKKDIWCPADENEHMAGGVIRIEDVLHTSLLNTGQNTEFVQRGSFVRLSINDVQNLSNDK